MKLYATEAGEHHVAGLSAITVSALARVEVPAALWRKHRSGDLAMTTAASLAARFAHDYAGVGERSPRFAIVSVVPALLETAAQLVATAGCAHMTPSNCRRDYARVDSEMTRSHASTPTCARRRDA